ncbi:MAG: hypothetical protein NVSMB62_15640 [Acidobacteriaceae bacterium]
MGHHEPIPATHPPAPGEPRPPSRASGASTRGSGEIPDKLYFRIGDVADICEVPAYVLRFWETEFPQLKPHKGGTGQRLYRRRDVETALRIKRLLYDEGYTIPGARQLLKTEQRHPTPQLSLLGPTGPDPRKVQGIRRELESILAMVSSPVGSRPAPQSIRAQRRTTGHSPTDIAEAAPSGPAASLNGEIPFDSVPE